MTGSDPQAADDGQEPAPAAAAAAVVDPVDSADLAEIRVMAIPVPVWARAQEHVDELLREFALIAALQADDVADLPARLIALVDDVTAVYGSFSAKQEARLSAAADAGEAEIDLTYRIPSHAAGAVTQLRSLLDEADDYCRAGEYLLTLTTPPDLVRFRNWYLGEFSNQLDGRPPTPWPRYTH